MLSFLRSISLLLALIGIAQSTSLRIQIPASNYLPNPNILSASTHATLQSGTSPAERTLLRQDNTLFFPEITTTGSHLLSIFSPTHTFAPYRVDISQNASITGIWETYSGSPWSQTGPAQLASPTTDATVSAKCTSVKNFYEERPAFTLVSLFKNPMILLGVLALAFTFGMPKMMENMDPETRAEYEAMQKKSPVSGLARAMQGGGAPASGGGGGSGLENFNLAGWMAGQKQDYGGTRASGADVGSDKARERRR